MSRVCIDSLTGLRLKDSLYNKLKEESNKNGSHEIAFISADMDNLKAINDDPNKGHSYADTVIANVGRILQQQQNESILAFRNNTSGDEFSLIIMNKTLNDVKMDAQRLLKKISINTETTVSMGIAMWIQNESSDSWYARAEDALHKAKETKNCLVIASDKIKPNAPSLSDKPLMVTSVVLYKYYHSGIDDDFLTTNINEIGVVNKGLENKGYECKENELRVMKAEKGVEINGFHALHRYYNREKMDHFYTTDREEIGTAIDVGKTGYTYEGIVGWAPPKTESNVVPLYRYCQLDNDKHMHFYTIDKEGFEEKDKYRFEGIQCYVYKN